MGRPRSSTTASADHGARSRTGSGSRPPATTTSTPTAARRCRRTWASAAARDGRTWFSDNLGAWHVIVLDGNCGLFGGRCSAGSDRRQWLRDDLAASGARCTVALLHQPLFSSGQHGTERGGPTALGCALRGGADLVLDGHDHDYERFGPQDPDGTADPARGIVEIVAGTGGAELEPFNDPRANSLVRLNDTYGVLELTLSADSWSMRFVGTDGSTHDQAAGTCH